jgi:murein L,D-transpeptidase YcbB/YkuD
MLVTVGVAVGQAVPVQNVDDAVTEHLRTRVEGAGIVTELRAAGEPVFADTAVPRFYERRLYRPAWSRDGVPLPVADRLVQAIRVADREGLRPADYHVEAIDGALARVRLRRARQDAPDPRRLADVDLLLTDAFLVYASHLLAGRIHPETIDPEWRANRRGLDLVPVLERALESEDVQGALRGLLPSQEGYARLRNALARYRRLAAAGGWPRVPEGPTLRLGDRDSRVAQLRQRLATSGDLVAGTDADPELFDDHLQSALRRFQERYGLEADGAVGPATVEALNVSATRRAQQIELNLERWRWLPQDLGDRHILVNIAGFDLRVVEAGERVLDMRVMVGRPYRRTPVFSDTMRYLVLAPYWHVPRNLAVQDQLPLIRRDPGHLARLKIRVFEGWGADTREIDPATIDWTQITANNFPYRLRQDPGPQNALGRVKFMFPNRFNVYLHDTPSRQLFAQASRDFSSGCIRIEHPIELAEYLLRDAPGWSRHAIERAADAGREKTVPLPRPIPVHLLYWTAWVDADGTMHFRRDIYASDERLERALQLPPPAED